MLWRGECGGIVAKRRRGEGGPGAAMAGDSWNLLENSDLTQVRRTSTGAERGSIQDAGAPRSSQQTILGNGYFIIFRKWVNSWERKSSGSEEISAADELRKCTMVF